MTPPLTAVIAPELAPEILLQQIYLNVRDFAIFTMDAAGLVTSWNLGAELIFGYAPDKIIGHGVACLFTVPDHAEGEHLVAMQVATAAGRAADFRWHLRQDGSLFWADGVLTPIRSDHGVPIGYLKILRDITDRKLAMDQIHRLATIDVLTGLSNRAAFDTRRSEMVSLAKRSGQLLLLLMIDLDQFKEINDLLGHQAGDQLLQLTAQRIRAVSRASDYVARLGGDEFALMQLNAPSPASGGMVAKKLLQELARPFLLGEREVKISASIGIAVCPLDSTLPDSLLKKADLALYHAKHAGRNRFHFYTQALDEVAHRRNADHSELKRLMLGDSCNLAYQPIQDMAGRTIAMEALLRLPGYLGRQPVEYAIGLAREMGLLPELGNWVTRRACAQLRRWIDSGISGVRICINTCARELSDDGYLRQLASALTGYSSLSYLRTLPVTTIKLDKSFLRGVPDQTDANAIVHAVIQLAQNLRLGVIAEGVESPAQASFLGDAGCNAFQGFLHSPALAADQATTWLHRHALH